MKWLLELLGINANPSADEFDEAIELLVEGTEPRLRLVPGYRRKLHSAMQKALIYIDETVDRIPGPLELDRKTFVTTPEAKAIFATPDELDTILHNSCDVIPFIRQPDADVAQKTWALLCVEKEEKNVLGMELAGNNIRREVTQRVVNFHDHQILAPATNVEAVRSGIKKCIFDGLITYTLRHIIELKSERRELEDQRRILHARLHARQATGNGLSKLIASAHIEELKIEDIEVYLTQTEDKLRKLPPSEHVLDAYLAEVLRILNQPEAYIQLNTTCFTLNDMCVMVDANASGENPVCFSELAIAQVLKRVVTLIQYTCGRSTESRPAGI